LTRYDRDFLPQIAIVITAVARSLATRVRAVDVPALLLSSFPLLAAQHFSDFRRAKTKLRTAYAQGGALTLPALFHASQSHIGVDSDGKIDSEYVRQLLELVLGSCLPEEDRESECERTIIREVLTKVVVKDVIPMLSQPWFWHRLILGQLSSLSQSTKVCSI
jgi:hypothetical protein